MDGRTLQKRLQAGAGLKAMPKKKQTEPPEPQSEWFREAVRELEVAQELDPTEPAANFLIWLDINGPALFAKATTLQPVTNGKLRSEVV